MGVPIPVGRSSVAEDNLPYSAMSLSHFLHMPIPVADVAMQTTTAAGTTIWSQMIGPGDFPNHPMSAVTPRYKSWKGGFVASVTSTQPPMSDVTLMLFFEPLAKPRDPLLTVNEALTLQTKQIFKLRGGVDVIMPIPFASNKTWADYSESSGRLSLLLFQPIAISLADNATVNMKVAVAAMPDFEMRVLRPWKQATMAMFSLSNSYAFVTGTHFGTGSVTISNGSQVYFLSDNFESVTTTSGPLTNSYLWPAGASQPNGKIMCGSAQIISAGGTIGALTNLQSFYSPGRHLTAWGDPAPGDSAKWFRYLLIHNQATTAGTIQADHVLCCYNENCGWFSADPLFAGSYTLQMTAFYYLGGPAQASWPLMPLRGNGGNLFANGVGVVPARQRRHRRDRTDARGAEAPESSGTETEV